jgi:tRNA(His) 5'-end guanylyltransferase
MLLTRDQFETLGDACKAEEAKFTDLHVLKGFPIVARLDGRSFSNFTKGLDKPYDKTMQNCMVETASALMTDLHPLLAYTQSDEITLLWFLEQDSTSQYPFGGKVQKLVSTLAGTASVAFNKSLDLWMPSRRNEFPTFDCRVWTVAEWIKVVDILVWRISDAERNSLNALAQSKFSHKELQGKSQRVVNAMLQDEGIFWDQEQDHFRSGVFLTKEFYVKEPADDSPAEVLNTLRTRIKVEGVGRFLRNPAEFLQLTR